MSQEHQAESCRSVGVPNVDLRSEPAVAGFPEPRAPGNRGRLWRFLALAFCFLLVSGVLLLSLRSFWLPAIGRFLVCADPLQPADAIVVLAGGGPQRVAHGVKLYQAGYAPWLIVTNQPLNTPGIRVPYVELMRTEAIWRGVPSERILMASDIVRTTYEEAIAVRRLAEEHSLRSLIIVTDPFHTRRARMSFRDALRGSGITISVQPANPSWYRADAWWQSQDELRETWTEYLKLLLYVFGYK
ncbi:MAG: YdcF family protein [Chloroflexi bacterium]|nr:YdcF family protein [Chloroflexota bacterium]